MVDRPVTVKKTHALRPGFPARTPMSRMIAQRDRTPRCFGNHRTPAILCPQCAWEKKCLARQAAKAAEAVEESTD